MTFDDDDYPTERLRTRLPQAWHDALNSGDDLESIFGKFAATLAEQFDINKGFLAVRDGSCTRFLAVASFREDGSTRRLSLQLPGIPSLFEEVAESREAFSENFVELFDGNHIEKNLLMDDDTVSYILKPLKFEGTVVGLLGFSSDQPDTFVTFEESQLDSDFEKLGEIVGAARTEAAHV